MEKSIIKSSFPSLEKSLVQKKVFFIRSSLPSLVSTGDRRAATQESPSVLEQRSVFFSVLEQISFFLQFFFKRNIKS